MKRITLQWKITILTAIILFLTTSALTWMSISSAQITLMEPILASELRTEITFPATELSGSLGSEPSVSLSPVTIIEAKKQFDFGLIGFASIVTLIGMTAVYFVTGRVLRPLQNLSRTVKSIDEHTLSIRLPESSNQDEVSILTGGFNQMLQRIEDAFARQKRFTANAAHELKTPLAVMKTSAQVLEKDNAADLTAYQQNNQKTIANVDRLAGIINDLLLLASIGECPIEKEAVQLDALLDAIQDELGPMLEKQDMQCVVDVGTISVPSNPELLYRVFSNLMTNACKYGRSGGVIHILAQKADHSILIQVSDDGPGIEQEHLPYIFDAFYRVDKSRSREIGGSGLGLSLVKSIVEALDGSVTVESRVEEGTQFTIILPQ